MKLSLNWVSRYVDLSGKSVQEIEHALTLIGFEVDSVETLGVPQLENVQVGEVLSFKPHPNADRLRLCQIKTSPDEEPRAIVCGASNFKEGDRVMVATPGAKLPTPDGGSFKIKKSKIRGEVSLGMMCSAKELGLGQDHDGIMILKDRPEIGTPINDIFKDNDSVFDIELTANRPDCLSHIGLARELAAYFELPLKEPQVSANGSAAGDKLIDTVTLESDTCPLYYAISVRGVKVAPSPDWLRKSLEAVGLNSINNVVDVTNYVLMEYGQPLHAFDANKLKGGKIIVRHARDGEQVTTLDDKERKLSSEMTVIADAERAVAVAGVMGCADVEVDDSTTDVLLEAAWFKPAEVRRTSRKLGLSSDSSHRYERGVDFERTRHAALRAIDLILETAGGTVSGNLIQAGEIPEGAKPVTIHPDAIRKFCGYGPDDATIRGIFERLELAVSDAADGAWEVAIPSWRFGDLTRPVDLIEEFVRIYGTDNIPQTAVSSVGLSRDDAPLANFNAKASALLSSRQLNECYHYTLRDSAEVAQWYGEEQADKLRLSNPLASDQGSLRHSLIPGLLDALRLNRDRGNAMRGLYEIGRTFSYEEEQRWERASVAFVLPVEEQSGWLTREKPDFYTVKALVEHVLGCAGVPQAHHVWEHLTASAWQEGHAAASVAYKKNDIAAAAGHVSLQMLKAWDIDVPVLAGEIHIRPSYFEQVPTPPSYQAFSTMPASHKDLALVVDSCLLAEHVRSELEAVAKKATGDAFALETVKVFDVYQGQGLPENKKSLAFSLRFRAADRTLKDEEVNKVFDTIQKEITAEGKYAVRG